MVERLPAAPRISGVQRLWLLELGVDRPLLARLAPDSPPVPARSAGSAMPVADDATGVGDRASGTAALAALRQGHNPLRTAPTGANPNLASQAQPSKDHISDRRTRPEPGAATPINDIAAKTPTQARMVPGESPVAESSSSGDVQSDWAALEAQIQACQMCELHTGRHRAVAGSGAIESVSWLVVGEAPGERDDRLGQPFQGKAGELLHAMLGAAAIDPVQGVFYTNLVKCRPRSNRLPTAEEIAACQPHLHKQIALLRPRRILALGRLAAHALLAEGKSDARSFEALRGRVHEFQLPGDDTIIPLVVTYHPASLLSRPRHKAASWQDLNLARSLI